MPALPRQAEDGWRDGGHLAVPLSLDQQGMKYKPYQNEHLKVWATSWNIGDVGSREGNISMLERLAGQGSKIGGSTRGI